MTCLRRTLPSDYESGGSNVVNAMTIDVEDYFQVSAFDRIISRSEWSSLESRVCRNTDRLLEIFDEFGVRGTFFILGWVADRFPDLVRRIAGAGHEIASHGYEHRLVFDGTPESFRADVRRAKVAIETASGRSVLGYRAPSYSITRDSLWAIDVLIEEGYLYDASIYPVRHDRYGIPDAPRYLHRITRPHGGIWELPGSTVRYAGANLPIGGGGYFRMLPYRWTSRGIRHVNVVEGKPAVFYLHPWEIDSEQPRFRAPLLTRLRHYRNLHQTESRLRRLLGEFAFGSLLETVLSEGVQSTSAVVSRGLGVPDTYGAMEAIARS